MVTPDTQRRRALKKLDELTKNSDLTEEDVLEIGRKINQAVARKHGINT